jgi:hypothetical protein
MATLSIAETQLLFKYFGGTLINNYELCFKDDEFR